MTEPERRAYRDNLQKILPAVPAFDDWLKKTDELPPDFDALPRNNALPDPLITFRGKAVQTRADWQDRRIEILSLYQKYVWGQIPPHPTLDHADVTEAAGQGFRTRTVILHVGPAGKGTMHVTLQIPDRKGPLPVLMGPGLLGPMSGNAAAVIRGHGYILAQFAASDAADDSINMGALYPDCDPGSLPRRGWAASCVVDYLLTLPEVDGKHIAISGYSRDGKAMTIGAALDERIAAVVAGSPGVGGILPFRLAGERNQAESIQSTTAAYPDWFHKRLRFFVGREDRLPVDGNLLLAAIAPRPFIEVAGLNDEVSNDWGDEQSFHSAQKVYDLLNAPNMLGINRVPGPNGTGGYHGANDWESSMTFLDIHFGKSDKAWTNHWLFPWNFEQWKKSSGESVDLNRFTNVLGGDVLFASKGMQIDNSADWEKRASGIRKEIIGMLGDPTPAPAAASTSATFNPWGAAGPPDVPAWVIGRSLGARAISEFGWYGAQNTTTASRAITFNGIKAKLFYPANTPAGTKLPAVIWLHSYSYPLGYMWVYHREVHPILALVQAGYAVLAYDQSGFGSRMDEAATFTEKYPHWSQMGQMVEDARAGVHALTADDAIDPARLYLFGYAMGGNVALHTAALEPQVKGVVSIAGFTPMRTDTFDKGTGGIARYAVDRGLIPRLGFYIGHESQIPYDYNELIATIAPRPVYIVSPKLDRDANFDDVHAAIESARAVYALYGSDASKKLQLDEPWDCNRLPTQTQDRIIAWMKENMK